MNEKISDIELTPSMIEVLKIIQNQPLSDEYAHENLTAKNLRAFAILTLDERLLKFNDPFYTLTGIAEDWLELYNAKQHEYWSPIVISNAISILALTISAISLILTLR